MLSSFKHSPHEIAAAVSCSASSYFYVVHLILAISSELALSSPPRHHWPITRATMSSIAMSPAHSMQHRLKQ